MARNSKVDWSEVDDVLYGCANQAGEDNRNVARMATLLAGLPVGVPASTINRLCASSLDAIGTAARAIKAEEADLIIAGGVENMSRSPYVFGKAAVPFSRQIETFDTTLGWRFVNPLMQKSFGIDSMPETAENVANQFNISREDQDGFALRSQQRAATAISSGFFTEELVNVLVPSKKGREPTVVSVDEHPRETSIDTLSRLKPVVRPDGTVTAGNASGINDGAAAVIIASEAAANRNGLVPRARIVGMAVCGVEPRIMGFGPAPAIRKVLQQSKLSLSQMDVIELNEAFAAQSLAVLRDLQLADDAPHVNPNGGAIALGHPLGASGARLVITAINQLHRTQGRYALCTMCIGVGQGIALILERV
jgi:3-oxoadipyl-CoA thiolase